MHFSEFALVCIAVVTAFAEHEVIGELHVQVLAGKFQFLGDFVVAGAWIGVSGRVVVT